MKMTDELKFIVNNVNAMMKTEYNLISFDSMSSENVLQVLVDVLSSYNAVTKFEVKFTDREDSTVLILESLKKIQYHVRHNNESITSDPIGFRKNIKFGDKRTIYPILKYVFENKDKIKQLIYLAQFLIPIQITNEAIANSEISDLWDSYLEAMEEFKVAHKTHTESSRQTALMKELRNDINAIEMEKDNVIKRIDRTQTRLDKVPQQELLLEAAHSLRVERDRQKDLQSHLDEQKHQLQRFRIIQERLQKEISNARIATKSTSPQYLMETIQEEIQVMEFLVKQKLPKELTNLQKEIQLLENIVDEPNISQDYVNVLENKIDKITKDIQRMIERKLSERGGHNDTLIPFRQQAGTVARNKDMAAEQLNDLKRELRDVDMILQKKQHQLNEIIGDVILRGEELQQYVNKLKAKSSVYKKHRSELASVKAEIADLTQTLNSLKSQDPSLSTTLDQMEFEMDNYEETIRPQTPIEERGLTELARLVDTLKRSVISARDRIAPLSIRLRTLRERMIELKDDRDSKKQNYERINATLKTEASVLESEIIETERIIRNLESEWQQLQSEYERAVNLLERVRDDKQNSGEKQSSNYDGSQPSGSEDNQASGSSDSQAKISGDRQAHRNSGTIRESLQIQIMEQEKLFKDYKEVQKVLLSSQEYRSEQKVLWIDIKSLLEEKLLSLEERREKGSSGTLSIGKNSETLILQ